MIVPALLAAVIAGCVGAAASDTARVSSEPAPTFAGLPAGDPMLTRLNGPWTAIPIALPPNLLAEVDRACRAARHDVERLQLVVADARGESLVHAFYVTSGQFSTTSCLDMELDPFGRIAAEGFGQSDPTALPAVGERDLVIWHQTSEEAPRSISHIAGLAGAAIAEVRVTSVDDPAVVATVSNRWFAAWFPSEHFTSRITVRGYDADGVEVTTVEP